MKPCPHKENTQKPGVQKMTRGLRKIGVTKLIKQKLFERASRKCEKCGSTRNLEVHHKIPIEQGGTHDLSNLKLLCHRCVMTNFEELHKKDERGGEDNE